MSVRITGKYLGNKRMELTHVPSGATLITDAPKDNQGEGRSFSPTDLAATSLASCIVTTMSIYAEQHDINLTGTWVEIEKHMQATPRKIARLPVNIHLPKRLDADQRERVEKAGSHCPVHRSLDKDLQVEVSYFYDID